jgi:hypothetical protein
MPYPSNLCAVHIRCIETADLMTIEVPLEEKASARSFFVSLAIFADLLTIPHCTTNVVARSIIWDILGVAIANSSVATISECYLIICYAKHEIITLAAFKLTCCV